MKENIVILDKSFHWRNKNAVERNLTRNLTRIIDEEEYEADEQEEIEKIHKVLEKYRKKVEKIKSEEEEVYTLILRI